MFNPLVVLLSVTAAVLTLSGVRRFRAPSNVAKRAVRRAVETIPSVRAEVISESRARLQELRRGFESAKNRLVNVLEIVKELAADDAAEILFTGARRFFAWALVLWDFAAQLAINVLTYKDQTDIASIAQSAAVISVGPALFGGFIAAMSFRMFFSRPQTVRRTLDMVAYALGLTAGVALLIVALTRTLGTLLPQPMEDALPVLVFALASTCGISGGLLLGVHHRFNSVDKITSKLESIHRADQIYAEAIKQLDALDAALNAADTEYAVEQSAVDEPRRLILNDVPDDGEEHDDERNHAA